VSCDIVNLVSLASQRELSSWSLCFTPQFSFAPVHACPFQIKCRTCGEEPEYCIGHFGHINLAKPMYHIGFIPFVLKVLRCVCHHCHRLLIGPVRGFPVIVRYRNCLHFFLSLILVLCMSFVVTVFLAFVSPKTNITNAWRSLMVGNDFLLL
jgi:hypothetical protein